MVFRILGINDEQTTCDCCGRTGLKKTVVLTNGEGEVRYGTECAARALRCGKKDVERTVRTLQKVQEEEAERVRRACQWEEERAYESWLLAHYGETRSNMEHRRAYRASMAS